MLARLGLLLAGRASSADMKFSSGASIAQAREALAFWRSRLSQLSWHRRAARREARTRVSRARVGLIRAHLQERQLGHFAAALQPLVVALGRTRGDHLRWLWAVLLRRNPLVRRWLLTVAVTAVGSLVALALLAVFAAHLVVS